MNDIRMLIRLAARRLEWTSYLGILHFVAVVFGSIALLLMIADRLPAEPFVPWVWVGPTLAASAGLVAFVLWRRRRMSDMQVALEVDERLDLREKLSTALQVHGQNDAFALAAVEDAVKTAADKRAQETVRRRFGVAAPNGWWISPLLVLFAVMVGFFGQIDAFADDDAETTEVVKGVDATTETINAVVENIKSQPELAKALSEQFGDIDQEGIDPDANRSAEDLKRDAIKKITDLNRKLDEIINGEKGKTADALEDMLQKMETPSDGPAKEFAEALSKGDFAGAKEQMKKMLEDLENGELSEEQKEKLAEQLEQIAEQLEKLAQNQQALENALKQAGMDPQLAQNPQALEQALQNNDALNEQQKQQLQQMAQAQQQAQQMCQGLGQACKNMGQAMQQGQQGAQGQAGQQAMNQLDQMEMLQQMLNQAQAAAAQCQGQCQGLGEGMGMGQAMQNWQQKQQLAQGGGMGQRGRGAGGQAPRAPTPSGTVSEKANVKTTGEGDVIAQVLVDGPLTRGESTKEVAEVLTNVIEGYDEAQLEDELPRKYHEAMKHYFGELEKRVEAMREEAATETSSEGSSSAESGDS